MISDIKKQLADNPEYIKNILCDFGFSNIDIKTNEIRCGVSEENNATSVRIKLNEKLSTNDYGRNIYSDLISYIIKVRKVSFKDVIESIKKNIGIEYFDYRTKCIVFGGFYDRIKKKKCNIDCIIYPEDILKEYQYTPNLRFLNDNISIESQKNFDVMYDIISQRIIFPIYNCYGEIIGVKGRANWDIEDDEPKYLYLIPCAISNTLYGYSHNYEYLYNDKIIVVEAEKSIMQAYTYGIRNIVALGGNSLSTQQCKLLIGLCPTEIVFAMDEGLDYEIIKENIKRLHLYTKFSDVQISIWNSMESKYIPKDSKASPTDYGNDIFNKILKEEIINEKQLEIENPTGNI